MSTITILLCISVGMMLGVEAHSVLRDDVEELEQTVEWLEKKLNNISEEFEKKIDTVESTSQQEIIHLNTQVDTVDNKVNTSQQELITIQNQLEYGGKNFKTYPHNSGLQLKDQDYLRLQFWGAINAWLGCPHAVCDLRTCPSTNNNYADFGKCSGEQFQIIGEGTQGNPIKSGQRIRLRYVPARNTWMGCPANNRCDRKTCPGTNIQASNFGRCGGEIFRIYARGRTNGQTIYNGDVVMLNYYSRYVTIQGENEGNDTSLNFCPGVTPPAYLSYGICSKNVFRIYRKP